MKTNYIIFQLLAAPVFLTSCSSIVDTTDPSKTLAIYIVLILVLISALFYINRIKRNKKREKANASIISFNQKVENILAKLDDPDEKIKALEMMKERIEDNEEYNKNRAWKYSLLVTLYQHMLTVYYQQGNEDKLFEVFERILELSPRHAMTYYNRGTMYSNRGEYGKALEDFNMSVKYDSSYANAYNNRGMIYDKLEQYEKAVDDYSHSLILHDSAITHFNRAKAYSSLGRYEESLADYYSYLRLDPYNNAELKDEAEKAIAQMENEV